VPNQAFWYRPRGRRNPGRPYRRWNWQKPEQDIGLILESGKKRLTFYFTIQGLMSVYVTRCKGLDTEDCRGLVWALLINTFCEAWTILISNFICLYILRANCLIFIFIQLQVKKPRMLSRYSDGLWARQLRFDSRLAQDIFLFFTASRAGLGPTQPPIQ
jgi:hypothetical protein